MRPDVERVKGAGPRAVRFVEQRLDEVEERTAAVDAKMDEVLTAIRVMQAKVDDLHREWVRVLKVQDSERRDP